MNPLADRRPVRLVAARAGWRWRGRERPPFAIEPGPEQYSVWDYPRPPVFLPDSRQIVIRWGAREIARTRRAIRALETSHAPSFYIPWDDVLRSMFHPAAGTSLCEWKGLARYWTLVDGGLRIERVAWSYPEPFLEAQALAGCVAVYPDLLECTVDGEKARPQPGGFYGGWITPELTGPFKGEPGSENW